jgi:hypothetical protein
MILKKLSAELIAAKKLEADAKANRMEIERKIFDLAGQNANTNFHVTSMYSFEADPAALMMATMSWPAELQPAYLSPRLDEMRLNKIKAEMPELWQQIVKEVEIKYKPTCVSVVIAVEHI